MNLSWKEVLAPKRDELTDAARARLARRVGYRYFIGRDEFAYEVTGDGFERIKGNVSIGFPRRFW